MSVRNVYFVRHGETVYNKEKRLQGWIDSPLSEKGEQQVRRVALKVKSMNTGVQFAYVSPLGRARQTAEIYENELGIELQVIDSLKEVSFGDFEGNTLAELDVKFPGLWKARQADKWNYCPPGGEANKHAVPRALEVVRTIEEHSSEEPLLIIAHFAINRLVISLLAKILPEETMKMDVPHETIYRAQNVNGSWNVSYLKLDEEDHEFQEGWLIQQRPENLPMGA